MHIANRSYGLLHLQLSLPSIVAMQLVRIMGKEVYGGAVSCKNVLYYDAHYRFNLHAFLQPRQSNHGEQGPKSLTSVVQFFSK